MSQLVLLCSFLLIILQVVICGDVTCHQEAPELGKCWRYNWGGTTKVHFFTCCNNCDEGTTPVCDAQTYQGASKGSYCGHCGELTGSGCGYEAQFTCGGCKGQDIIASNCSNWYREIPGFCWLYARCFTNACLQVEQSNKIDFSTFCGDGKCDPKTENSNNCPMDCCSRKNPVCRIKPNYCPPDCCDTPACCIPDAAPTPIGSVIDWWRPTFDWPIPKYYELCDGQLVHTKRSPIFGLQKPDLRGKFVRGVAKASDIGVEGGQAIAKTSSDPGHSHQVPSGVDEAGNICGSCAECHISLAGCGGRAIDPPSQTGKSGAHNHQVDTIPPYVGLLKLIRVANTRKH